MLTFRNGVPQGETSIDPKGVSHSAVPLRRPRRRIPGPLHGITVLDCATLFAGPLAATVLGDFGAEVIKIEHPSRPDPSRTHGPSRDGTGLWWKMLGRNKHTVTLDLSRAQGARLLLRLVREADVLIENFRPGTLERWGLSPRTCTPRTPAW